jgi:HSP90 family molecular chaperone
MANKITKVQMFEMIKAEVADNKDMVEFINHEIELLNKKSANKKPTKIQEQNEVLKDKIVEVLGNYSNGVTASEVLASDSVFTGLSNQKISALLKALVEEGKVAKTVDKKKSIFSLVA